MSDYQRSIGITTNAVQRYKTISGSTESYEEIGNLIDEMVLLAMTDGAVEDILDDGVPAKFVKVVINGEPCVVFLKLNDEGGSFKHKHRFAAISILSEAKTKELRERGVWTDVKGEPMKNDTRINGIGSKLQTALDVADMQGKPLKVAAAVPPLSTVTKATPTKMLRATPTSVSRPVTVGNPSEVYLVTWKSRGKDENGDFFISDSAEFLKSEVTLRIEELVANPNIDPKSVRVWKEVKARVRVEFED